MTQILRRLISVYGEISTRHDILVLSDDSSDNGSVSELSPGLFTETQSGKRRVDVLDFDALVELVDRGRVFVAGDETQDSRRLELSKPDVERFIGGAGAFTIS